MTYRVVAAAVAAFAVALTVCLAWFMIGTPGSIFSDEAERSVPPNQMAPKATTKEDKLNNSGETTKPNQPSQATQPGTSQPSTTQKSGGTAAGTSTSTSASVNLTPEQKTKIRQVIISDRSAPRVSSVTFQLNVGVAVPRSVRLAAEPCT